MFAFTGKNRFISIENGWSPYKNSKTTRDAYLDQDLSHLVTHAVPLKKFCLILYQNGIQYQRWGGGGENFSSATEIYNNLAGKS
jgi:hypothetical protein